MSVKLVVVALLAAAATVATATDADAPKPMLQLQKGCTNNDCTGEGCMPETYEVGKCTPKDGKYYKATCEGKPALKAFDTEEKCKNDNDGTDGTDVATKTCAEDGANSGTYHKVECPAPANGGGGSNPDDNNGPAIPAPYKGPVLFVNKTCDVSCKNCNETETYQANGTCFEAMEMPPGKPQVPAQGSNRRARAQDDPAPSKKYYKANCSTMTVTLYSDKDCTMDGQQTTYTKECDTKKVIAECKDTPSDNSSDGNSSSPDGNSSSPDGNSSNPDGGSSGGSPGGSGGSPGDKNSSDDSSNNSSAEGLGVSAVRSVGAFAVALLAMVLMC